MPRVSKGTVYRQKGSKNWFIKFHLDGKLKRETAATPDHDQAQAFLRQRLEEAARGRFTDVRQRPTFADMQAKLVANYEFKRNKTEPTRFLRRLARFFEGVPAEEITEERIAEYSQMRLKIDGAAPATLRRELAVLKRMLRLSAHRLPRVPLVDQPRVDNARQGFFEEEELQAVLPHLPEHARNLVEFLYLTGWRSGEAFRLTWADVNWKDQTVLLRDSKNREPRIFPFKYHARLEAVLRRQRDQVSRWELVNGSLCPAVFHWKGHPIRKLRRSWKTACKRAGLHGRLLHDFRRTAVRNLIRAGVQQAIAMKITGHKTDSIFRRYLIVDEELLAQATGAVAAYLEENQGPKLH
jgi:integrase